EDYVIATGETHTIRTFLELAFGYVDLDYQDYVVIDPQLYRPAEVNLLLGDCTKARKKLGWQSEVSLSELAKEMLDADLQCFQRQAKRECDPAVPVAKHPGHKVRRISRTDKPEGRRSGKGSGAAAY